MYIIIVDKYTCGIKKIEFDYIIIDISDVDTSCINYNNSNHNIKYIIGKYIFIDRFGFNPLSCMAIEKDFAFRYTNYLSSYLGFDKYKKTLLIKSSLEEINDLIEKYVYSLTPYNSYYNIYRSGDELYDFAYRSYGITINGIEKKYTYYPKASDTIIYDVKKLFSLYELAIQKVVQKNLHYYGKSKLLPTDIIESIEKYETSII